MDFKFIALLILIGSFMGMTVAQASCDPETQYEEEGQCCLMCKPGTSMSTKDCKNPRCQSCPDNHYQDKYTTENKCLLQPYCDRNKNFEDPFPKSKTQKSICECKVGFHCSSKDCITCVEHTVCQPGYGAKVIGNKSQDTECEKCPDGTFNNNTSWDAHCRKWTECETGYHVEEKGTHTTDNTCGLPRRGHIIVISIISVMAVITVVILVLLYRGCIKQRTKRYFKPLHPEEKPTCTETTLNMPLTPEENEDDPSHELSSEGFTEKGNQVMQERGKEEIVSRQESQLESQFESQEDSQSMDPFYKPVQACTSAVES
ncbi:tumor necrosis factor receptor superfamily member 5 isoform X2 [Oreochromis aureus]|uniref:TNFR-Cys domain-containing protein n=1 Tax=Oreochromis aureus TaxID=47969 RepID=A0A668VTC0_OREAU|nr:tumor necrosis factor receptor superfamily member 5 isoform X2 [Oreochromis aureus]